MAINVVCVFFLPKGNSAALNNCFECISVQNSVADKKVLLENNFYVKRFVAGDTTKSNCKNTNIMATAKFQYFISILLISINLIFASDTDGLCTLQET